MEKAMATALQKISMLNVTSDGKMVLDFKQVSGIRHGNSFTYDLNIAYSWCSIQY